MFNVQHLWEGVSIGLNQVLGEDGYKIVVSPRVMVVSEYNKGVCTPVSGGKNSPST